mmetsp:Transcript_11211/g.18866  ORF Transcript_11211/g.18866 Transcript_11211/m.18866 type:complete len:198 (+) Transcript_11211:983-1576(+)|eukprot:CAMPEP_0168619764 /NCGR_PEP_ID=MMETSP0449_2-20121227/6777_1 /TAXON_ID=1082188 /ORGANISM="Strombidium rassoulzadegani, Strain ras09" /LENGTH=197 /DNA_ID=CAMNT_0008660723 /DNA_START=901 /DNA_END=1494 /DNA_ORIENTATION=-
MPDGTDDVEIVILDHGIYTFLENDVRLSYTKLWRGMLTQNDAKIKEASSELGTDFHELFTSMVANRTYDDVMDRKKTHDTQSRFGVQKDAKQQKMLQKYAIHYHKDITDILSIIRRELLLILKTNNYLRAIDTRLGNPYNFYDVINRVTLKVERNEMTPKGGMQQIQDYRGQLFFQLWLLYQRIMFFFSRLFGKQVV